MNIEELTREVNRLTREVENLKANTTIPFPIDRAFRERFSIDSFAKLENQTTKVPADETRVVAAGDDVMKVVDGFLSFTSKQGTVYYIAYYT